MDKVHEEFINKFREIQGLYALEYKISTAFGTYYYEMKPRKNNTQDYINGLALISIGILAIALMFCLPKEPILIFGAFGLLFLGAINIAGGVVILGHAED
jgi:hypothetical protein